MDVISLHFCHRGHYGNHDLAHIRGTVQFVINTDEVYTKVLHCLEREKSVRSITTKTREFEHQNELDTVSVRLDVLQHLLELLTTCNVLAGETLIRIFSDNVHFLIVCIVLDCLSLCIQTVTINLY